MNTSIIATDKKKNAAYWDEIDADIHELILKIATAYSIKPISDEALAIYGEGIMTEAREIIIKGLEELGGEFPVVDENM